MSLDDFVISCQHAIDRVIRRFRRGGRPAEAQRRLLIVQIDGLSRTALEQAQASGHVPFISRLLERGDAVLQPMSVSLPTSTPAFQMAAFYGVRPDIPGFHYYSRARKGDIHFPRAGHAAWVEEQLASGRDGILQGGSAYGCCFTGGAVNSFFTFTKLTRPSGKGILSALSPFIVIAWVVGKNVVLSVIELVKAAGDFIAQRGRVYYNWRWLRIRILMSIWVRNFFTLAVARDVYEGVPAIYVNFLSYDEMAHAYGPRGARAMQALRDVDNAIGKIFHVLRRAPEHRYDAYILSDHGQTGCTPYRDITQGKRLERWIFDAFLHPGGASAPDAARVGLRRGMRVRRRETKGMMQQYMNYLDEDFFRREDPEAHEHDGVRSIAAGVNAFLYDLESAVPLDADGVEARFPGLAAKLSRSPGIGFVLARSEGGKGVRCYWRGESCELGSSQFGPFAERPDAPVVVEGILQLMTMPSAGDLVIYGIDAPDGDVSFIPEHGGHAGPSADEMHTFIIRPRHVTLPSEITHPIQLYEHFRSYRSGGA